MANAANPALPGGANSPLQMQSKTAYLPGLLVDEQNLLPDAESERNAIGEVLAGLLGSYNAQMEDMAVTLNFTPGSLVFSVGGIPQRLFVQGRIVDSVPVTSFTAATADPAQGRYDSLFVQYLPMRNLARIQEVLAINGSLTNTQVQNNLESVLWNYQTGTPGNTATNTLLGFELFAVVYIPAGATSPSLDPALTRILFSNAKTLLSSRSIVSLNSLVGLVKLIGGPGVAVGTDGNNNIVISSTVAAGVSAVNTQTGNVNVSGGPAISVTSPSGGNILISNTLVLSAGAGITCTKSADGVTWTIANTGASTSLNGLTGAVGVTTSTLQISASGNNIVIDVAPGVHVQDIYARAIRVGRFTGYPRTLALPTLPSGTWLIIGTITSLDLAYVGQTMTLTGNNATWDPSVTIQDTPGNETIELSGFAGGGQTPSITVSINQGVPNDPPAVLKIMAIRQ